MSILVGLVASSTYVYNQEERIKRRREERGEEDNQSIHR